MMDIDTKDKLEQRKFGLVMGAAFAVLTLIRWGHHRWSAGEWGTPSYVLLGIGAAFSLLGLLAPTWLQPVFWAWIKFAIGMNWFMTRLLLTIVFFLFIVPTRAVRSILRIDALHRKWRPGAATYWEEPDEQPGDPRRYLDQY
jgi:hypothetical protein